jgi:dUTP pyrophosphatase
MQIFIKKLYSDAKLPARATNGAIGFDAYAHNIGKDPDQPLPFTLEPGQRILVGLGIAMAVPPGMQCEIRPRSGLADKHGITITNSPGTLDPDYRGEAGAILINHGKEPFVIEQGMRIAQMIFSAVEIPTFEVVEKLPETIRSQGGFGHTGLTAIKEGTIQYDERIAEQDRFYMAMAIAAAKRSNCARGCRKGDDGKYLRDKKGRLIGQTRQFGCVIVKDDNVVSIGFNAQAPGQPLCADVGCLREIENITSGTQIERCRSIHAEWMAFDKMLIAGVGSSTKDAAMYVTAEPCEICAKMIAGSGIDALVVLEDVYPQNGIDIVKAAGINVRFVKKEDLE